MKKIYSAALFSMSVDRRKNYLGAGLLLAENRYEAIGRAHEMLKTALPTKTEWCGYQVEVNGFDIVMDAIGGLHFIGSKEAQDGA